MVFRNISSTAMQQVERRTQEMVRLHGLPDRFLGRELMRLSRAGRMAAPDSYSDPNISGYDTLILWRVLPRLAFNLGERDITPQEQMNMRRMPAMGQELRDFVGICMNNVSFRELIRNENPGLQSLGMGFANGNPVTIGLDRVAPPGPDSADWIARHIREISRNRFGDERFSAWAPEMQAYKSLRSHSLVMEDAVSPDPQP